jgi:hypothetical protein
MSLIDRATRTVAARFVWGGLAVLCLVGFFYLRTAQGAAAREALETARARTSEVATTIVASAANGGSGGLTLPSDRVREELLRTAATVPTIGRVLVWDARGQVALSLTRGESQGTPRKTDALSSALAGDTTSKIVRGRFVPLEGGDGPIESTRILQVFVPFRLAGSDRTAGVVEVDFLYGALGAPGDAWTAMTRALGLATVIFGALFVVSLVRGPRRSRQAGATIAPEKTATATATATVTVAPAPRSAWLASEEEPAGRTSTASRAGAGTERTRAATSSRSQPTTSAPAQSPPATAPPVQDPSPPAREDVIAAARVVAALARIEHLEAALKRASDDAETARARTVPHEELERVRREADERVAALEHKLELDGPEIEALRARVGEAEARAVESEALLATVQSDLAAARAEVEARPAPESELSLVTVDVPEQESEPEAESQPEPQPEPQPKHASEPQPEHASEPQPEPTDPIDLLAVLAERVADAEARAKSARDEAMQLSPEAADLRRRLARTAARKKLGPTG